jgi:hypothetical protein
MMCTSCMSNYYFYIYIEIINNGKIRENNGSDDNDVYFACRYICYKKL